MLLVVIYCVTSPNVYGFNHARESLLLIKRTLWTVSVLRVKLLVHRRQMLNLIKSFTKHKVVYYVWKIISHVMAFSMFCDSDLCDTSFNGHSHSCAYLSHIFSFEWWSEEIKNKVIHAIAMESIQMRFGEIYLYFVYARSTQNKLNTPARSRRTMACACDTHRKNRVNETKHATTIHNAIIKFM